MIARQGDVLIERMDASVSTMPGTERKPSNGRYILVEGEATGHHHSVAAEDIDTLFANDETGEMFLRVMRETRLTHQEHAPIVLTPGTYRVTRQREYTPEGLRNVAD